MDRRNFLRAGAIASIALSLDMTDVLASSKKYQSATRPSGRVKLRIGVVSDIHIVEKESTDLFEKALRFFRDRKVDGVIVAGDMADWGTDTQLEYVQQTWEKVFPDNRGADGRLVERLFVTGNHDITSPTNKRVKKLGIPLDEFFVNHKAESWERIFHEPYAPIWKKEVGGYCFIGAQYDNADNVPGLEEFLSKASLPKDKPFFYIQHTHPKGTCSAPWTWGQDDGTSTKILSEYPNAVSFTGHSHTSLTDDRTLWRGAFTSVGTASLRYILPFGGRENSQVTNSKEKVPSQMEVHSFNDGQHAQLMSVYDNCITLERFEISREDALGTWILPLPLTGKAVSFDQRAQDCPLPQFSNDASVKVSEADGKDRYGTPEHQYTVHFPTALEGPGRAYDYEVCVEMEDIDTIKTMCTKRVYSPGYHLAANRDTKEVQCVFKTDELPGARRYRFAIRPCNCFGIKGEAIYSQWFESAGAKEAVLK